MRPIALPSDGREQPSRAGAISIVLREPAMTRESTSWPSWSVPKGFDPSGEWRTALASWNVGSLGAMW